MDHIFHALGKTSRRGLIVQEHARRHHHLARFAATKHTIWCLSYRILLVLPDSGIHSAETDEWLYCVYLDHIQQETVAKKAFSINPICFPPRLDIMRNVLVVLPWNQPARYLVSPCIVHK